MLWGRGQDLFLPSRNVVFDKIPGIDMRILHTNIVKLTYIYVYLNFEIASCWTKLEQISFPVTIPEFFIFSLNKTFLLWWNHFIRCWDGRNRVMFFISWSPIIGFPTPLPRRDVASTEVNWRPKFSEIPQLSSKFVQSLLYFVMPGRPVFIGYDRSWLGYPRVTSRPDIIRVSGHPGLPRL